jgi:hypothetical protein
VLNHDFSSLAYFGVSGRMVQGSRVKWLVGIRIADRAHIQFESSRLQISFRTRLTLENKSLSVRFTQRGTLKLKVLGV